MVREATSKFDQLSKGAFDVTAVKHGANWKTDLQSLATESFDTGVKGVFKSMGLNDSVISKLGSVGSSDFLGNLMNVGTELLSAGVSSLLGEGLSMIFNAGMTGYDLFMKAGSKRDFNFQRGQWVLIDNGTRIGGLTEFKKENATGGKEFEQALDISDRRRAFQFEGNRDISFGFYVGQGKEENYATVFNFRLWRDEDVFITSLNAMPEAEASKLDSDELVGEIRELKFKQEECREINSTVPTNPGCEVLLDKVRFHVVTATGQQVTVEDEWGLQKVVDISKLERGRTTHTKTYNYKADGSVTGGFLGSGEDSIYAGRWLWVSGRDLGYPAARELVCVQYIHNSIHVFYALDGEKGTFSEGEVTLVSDEFNELFSQNTAFSEFKGFALAGYDMKRVSLGKRYPLLCIGVTNTDAALEKTPMSDIDFCDTVYSRLEKAIGRVGDLDLHKEIDTMEEWGKKDRAVNQHALDVIGEEEEFFEPTNGSEGLSGGLMLGGVAVIAALLINSVG